MKAVQVTRFGDPSVLTLVDLPDPEPGPGQVAIDVTHAAVGLIDLHARQGLYKDREGLPQPPYVPGLEVAGTVRALGEGVSGFTVGEKVVALPGNGTGGYASVFISQQDRVISTEAYGIDPALAVAAVPNAIMAHIALTGAIHLAAGESVLVHGALGAFAATFPGIARQLGASRIVGTVRTARTGAAAATKLPYDAVVDSDDLPGALGQEKFDVIVDPVGGTLRTQSLDLLAPSGRLLLVGNASGDWEHTIPSNAMWYGNTVVAGFNAGGYIPAHPETIPPAARAALEAVAAGLIEPDIEILPFADAATAHEKLENHSVNGRVVLVP
ncbi:quinone oxidoreductase family protein [Streptomyces nodosus]|uniref:NADPH quinone reductase n=1 Tax=Streptomyces nodosus TaxID=40318 RepID=A0A0B5DUG1_9ACTN|nr:zinc-binding dehydrogenase [Streptomyces nodosus]AJE44331.1 NADPH quinone reductase [Streptomyces nodosus]MBB4795963.1 NADPH2:quinone reductase [Streptomyces nodosus]QEV42824.1 NADPH quinone reductase [Streptomyces nodosus]